MRVRLDAENRLQPRMRGVLHEWSVAFFLAAGIVLVLLEQTARGRAAMAVYTGGLVACLGTSALYHRGFWSATAKDWLGRADHAAIFVLIASTYTPICVLVLHGTLSTVMLIGVWVGAAAGIAASLIHGQRPAWIDAAPYVVLGWVGIFALPDILGTTGGGALAMLIVGGGLYTAGALIYASRWPNPFPRTFGYHELFHLFVIAAAAVHMVMIYVWVMPRGRV